MYIARSSDDCDRSLVTRHLPSKVIFSDVWSKIAALLERLMKIHSNPPIDLMHWQRRHVGGQDLSRCAHVLCWQSVGALSLSVSARARAGPAVWRLARWLHAWRWRTWQCLVWPPTHGGALLWRHMHKVYTMLWLWGLWWGIKAVHLSKWILWWSFPLMMVLLMMASLQFFLIYWFFFWQGSMELHYGGVPLSIQRAYSLLIPTYLAKEHYRVRLPIPLPMVLAALSYDIYLNACLTSFVGYTQCCSLPGWTTRGRHHSPVSVCLSVWPLHHDFSLLFCEKWSWFFYVHRVWLSYTRDRQLKVSSERLNNEDKTPCPRALLPGRDSNRGPSVRKSEGLIAQPRQLLIWF